MATKLTSKGQVTIPKAVRQHLGIGPGSAVEFELAADGRVIVAALPQGKRLRARAHVRHRFDAIQGSLKSQWTTDELMKLLRG